MPSANAMSPHLADGPGTTGSGPTRLAGPKNVPSHSTHLEGGKRGKRYSTRTCPLVRFSLSSIIITIHTFSPVQPSAGSHIRLHPKLSIQATDMLFPRSTVSSLCIGALLAAIPLVSALRDSDIPNECQDSCQSTVSLLNGCGLNTDGSNMDESRRQCWCPNMDHGGYDR